MSDIPVDGVIRSSWRAIIVEKDKQGQERVNRISYELSVLQALRERLRSKEVWVVGAHRYRNPDEDLPQDFDSKRTAYYTALKQPEDANVFVWRLCKDMENALTALDQGLPKNPKVKLRPAGKNRIVLTPLDTQPEPVKPGPFEGGTFQPLAFHQPAGRVK